MSAVRVTRSVAARAAEGAPLVDRLASAIQAMVLSGAAPVGTRLRQEALAEEFGVSRTPVREALRKLQAIGLVEVVPNRGAIVRGPSAREIREAYEVRAELEGLAAELATTLISDDDLRRLRRAESLFRRSVTALISQPKRAEPRWDDESVWVQANELFHQTILDAAANGRLSTTIADLHRSFPRALSWSALVGNSRLLDRWNLRRVQRRRGLLSRRVLWFGGHLPHGSDRGQDRSYGNDVRAVPRRNRGRSDRDSLRRQGNEDQQRRAGGSLLLHLPV